MIFLVERWWCLYLAFSYYAICATGAEGERRYQVPSVHEVVNKAMFVVKYESPIVGATDQIGRIEQLLFPFTNFTCSGSITRLMFVASKPNEIANLSMISSWPTFSLWHRQGDSYNEVSSIGPFHPDQITSVQPPSRSIFNDRQVEVVMVNFSSPVHFEAGNILGLRQHPFNTSSSRYIRVLRQRWGYGLKLICEPSGCPVDIEYPNQEVPYIAVETAPSGQQCAMGFLNEQSLRMIVEAPRDESRSFIFTEIPHLDMSMPLNQSGPLRKMIMAAFFYVTASVGWPELQIIRRASNGTSYIAFTTNTIEPKPTRYLNLYEYDLAETRFYVRPGDVLNLSWQGDADWTRFRFGDIDRVRFNLAYYRNGTSPEIPMVSIVVGDCDSETDQLTLNLLNYCENVTEPTTSGITSTQSSNTILSTNNQNDSKSELTTVVVIGVVTSCALLLMTMIIIMIIMVLAMHWHKSTVKKSSTEENDSKVQYTSAGEDNIIYNSIIEVDVNEAYTIPTGPNVAYSTLAVYDTKPHDYDYIM